MISDLDKIKYMQDDYSHITLRVDPVTREPLGVLTLSRSLQEARLDAHMGTVACLYEICDLLNERKIEQVWGKETDESNA